MGSLPSTAAVCAICLLVALSVHEVAAEFELKTWNANMAEELLVLDVGSVLVVTSRGSGSQIRSIDRCKEECDRLPNCNGFNYCDNPEGCGKGCAAWAAKKANIIYFSGGMIDPISTKLPIDGFGLRNGGGCHWDKPDVWRQGTCSLKKVSNPSYPRWHSKDTAAGWVSGTIIRPASCKGFSTQVCSACLKSANPKRCLACAQKSQQISFTLWDRIPAAGCPSCFNVGAFQDRCLQCVQRNEECSRCASAKYPKQCFECYKQESPKNAPFCLRCTENVNSEVAAIQCVHNCLPAIRPYRCSTPDQKGCIHDFSNICTQCSNMAPTSAATCIKCSIQYPGNDKCAFCGNAPPEKQAGCLKCAMQASVTTNDMCSDCFSDRTLSSEQCLACYQNSNTKLEVRSNCGGCNYYFRMAREQQKCYSCMATTKELSGVGACFSGY